jgi:cytidylate kinase
VTRSIIVISGLPASGKTTLAHLLGEELGFAVIDKDDFLEVLLGSVQEFDADFRFRCSRKADKQFEEAARAAGDVILVSHWQGSDEHHESGTPSAWLREFETVIEIVCHCSVAMALERFKNRNRHQGHGDSRSDLNVLQHWFEEDSLRSSLGIGTLITVNTETFVDIKKLARECRQYV